MTEGTNKISGHNHKEHELTIEQFRPSAPLHDLINTNLKESNRSSIQGDRRADSGELVVTMLAYQCFDLIQPLQQGSSPRLIIA